MSSSPEVSVVTTAHNESPFISQAVESILPQHGVSWEMVVVDDASDDETPSVVRSYADRDPRVRLLQNGRLGRVAALNYGLEESRGKYIAILDADDVALPGRLLEQVRAFSANERLGLYGSAHLEIDVDGGPLRKHAYPNSHSLLVWALENVGAFFANSSAMFRRSAARRVGGYRARFERSMDWDMWLRLSETGLLGCHPHEFLKLRRRANSLSTTNNGRLQQTMGVAGTLSHMRRRAGLVDPIAMDEGQWKQFLSWLELRLEQLGYFNDFAERERLRAALSRRSGEPTVLRLERYMKTLMRPQTYRTLAHMYARSKLVPALVHEMDGLTLSTVAPRISAP